MASSGPETPELLTDSPVKLTQFTPLRSEVRQPIGTFSLSRLFRWSRTDTADSVTNPPETTTLPLDESELMKKEKAAEESGQGSSAFPKEYWQNSDAINVKPNTTASSSPDPILHRDRERDIVYTRSLTNVLRRISSIRDKRGQMPQSYKDSDFKQYWMPDNNCKECYECGDKFTTFRRRHHCRVCGQIFCSRCCNQEIPGKIMGYTGDLRVCTHCCRIVLSYIQSSDLGADLHTLQEDLHNKLSMLNTSPDFHSHEFGGRNIIRRKISVGFREEDFARIRTSSSSDMPSYSATDVKIMDQMTTEHRILAQDSIQLREIWLQIQDPVKGVEFQNHWHRLRNYPNCTVGSQIVDWLLSMDKATSRLQAVAIGQALVDAKLMEAVTNQDQLFVDEYSLYRIPSTIPLDSPVLAVESCESLVNEDAQDPLWVKEIAQDDDETMGNGSDSVIPDGSQEKPQVMRTSTSLFYLDLNVRESKVSVSKPKQTNENTSTAYYMGIDDLKHDRDLVSSVDQGVRLIHEDISHTTINDEFLKGALYTQTTQVVPDDFVAPRGWHSRENLNAENGERVAFDRLMGAYLNHRQALLRQLLSSEGLSPSWMDIIIPIVQTVSEVVRPDVKNDNDDMDIRQYIQFKKIPGGLKSECGVISGVICTKNVAHKKMRCKISSPNILILSSPIVYQRQENKLLSLEPLVMQEFSYLKNVVSKIASFKPDIVLVEKTVSRLALNFLLDHGITLVLNVKPSVMERVARSTQAHIVSSIDAQITRPQLGLCNSFRVIEHALPNGKTKTLMYFEGCASHLGCTISLRGGSSLELRKVKKVAQFMIYVEYNWRLERSYLMDEFVMPPPLPDECPLGIIGDEIESNGNNTDETDLNSSKQYSEKIENEKRFSTQSSSTSDAWSICSESTLRDRASTESSLESQTICGQSDTEMEGGTTDNWRGKLDSQFVEDFSDPLHSFLQSADDEPIQRRHGTQLHVAHLPFSNNFRKALDDVSLSSSPFIKNTLPYLESDAGRNCIFRSYFPNELYWSAQLCKENGRKLPIGNSNEELQPTYMTLLNGFLTEDVMVKPWHRFTTLQLTSKVDNDVNSKNLLADYRARGGRIVRLCQHDLKEKEKEKNHKNKRSKATADPVLPMGSGLTWERKVDALDPFYHQRLVVSFCSYSPQSNNAPNFCVCPRIVNMDFYGCNDITLGGFLERYCFRQSYVCASPTCCTPMIDHIRKFAHGNGCVHIVLRQMDNPSPVCQNTIVVWSWCRQCGQVTPRVPLSRDAWSLSFAKYLELRFHGTVYLRRGSHDCGHLLHHDYYQYFGYKQRVVAFKYSPIILREIVLPPLVITSHNNPVGSPAIIEEIKRLAVLGNSMYSTVVEWLVTTKTECCGTKYEQTLSDFIMQLKVEQSKLREKIEEIQLKLTSPTLENKPATEVIPATLICGKDTCFRMWKISDCVVNVKRLIAEAVSTWNGRVHEFIQQRKKEEKQPKLATGVSRLISNPGVDTVSPKSVDEVSESLLNSIPIHKTQQLLAADEQHGTLSHASSTASFGGMSVTTGMSGPDSLQSDENEVFRIESSDTFDNIQSNKEKMNESLVGEPRGTTEMLMHSGSDPLILDMVSPASEADETMPVSKGLDESEMQKNDPRGHERSRSEGDGRLLTDLRLKTSLTNDEACEVFKVEKKMGGVKTILSQLLSNSTNVPLQNPFPTTEHHLLPRCEKIPIVVYEGEISSIVAYALSSGDYERKLQDLRISLLTTQQESGTNSPVPKKMHLKINEKEGNVGSSTEAASSVDSGGLSSSRRMGMLAFYHGGEHSGPAKSQSTTAAFDSVLYSAAAVPDPDMLEWEEGMDERDDPLYSSPDLDKSKGNSKKASNYHVEVEFADSTAKFFCRIYFAEQFRKLRKMVFPQDEETYIRSLSRCISWQAKGGKSGLAFCKTHDDRFVLKQMSRKESQSFPDFAPAYFQFIKRSFSEQKPTALAKIVGVYRIGYSYSQSNSASKMDLLVMENLFYGRNIVQKFDLKGSMSNRLVNTSGKQDGELVLMDENLLKMACENPLYTRQHSKTVLIASIKNDSEFLSQQLVMDYSLVVGVDEAKQEFVVGIIDYIRTFTWDKMIEMLVKGGILGKQGKPPTILAPEIYRKRFCEAMDRYFLHVPNRWSGLGQGMDF